MQLDPEVFADMVAAAIEAATAPLVARIAVLEGEKALLPRDGRDGKDGKDAVVDIDDVARRAAELVPPPKDGRDGSNGSDGTSFLTGRGAPSFDARAGDVYLDAVTGDIYQCR